MDNIISRKELRKRIGISRSTEWRYDRQGILPTKVILGGRVLGYLESSYKKWIQDNSDSEE